MEPLQPAELLDWIRARQAQPALQHYCELLQEAGTRTNLIGTLETERIWDELLLDAVASYRLLPADVRSIADIGSGAGLPGLTWALLARAEGRSLALTLLEPRAKRLAFLEAVVQQLDLSATVVCVKATLGGYRERYATQAGWQGFDLVTSRAVFPLSEVVKTQQILSHKYQLVHASGADLDVWQPPHNWQIADRRAYQPAGAQLRGYILLQRA